MRVYPQWRWRLDEAFVKVNGKLCYLWRAVDYEGEVLEAVVTAKRDTAAALKLLKRIMKKYGRRRKIVTDGLCSYSVAMNLIGAADRHEVNGCLNNRAENSHQPFRRRKRAMQRFRSLKTLQKFSTVHNALASRRVNFRRWSTTLAPASTTSSSASIVSSAGRRVLLRRVKRRVLPAAQRLLRKLDQMPRDEAHAEDRLDLAAA
jgi:transposase-like protein